VARVYARRDGSVADGAEGMGHRWSAGAPPFRVTVPVETTPPNGAGDGRSFACQNGRCSPRRSNIPALRR
jgi:hypothetical protein